MRRFLLHLVPLQAAMAMGALVCLLVGGALRTSTTVAAVYHPGSYLYFAGDLVFLTVPVIAWIAARDHAPRRGIAVAAAMLVPVAVIVAAGEATAAPYLPWLVYAMYPAMTIGMIAFVLLDRDQLRSREIRSRSSR